MEEANKTASEKNDLAEESSEDRVQNSGNQPAATNSDSYPAEDLEQAGTSSEVTSSINETVANRTTGRRNYRRRTEGSDDSSSNGEDEAQSGQEATVEVAEEAQETQSSDSDAVSLEELHVSASDADNRNARR